jgi:hypothetical protein
MPLNETNVREAIERASNLREAARFLQKHLYSLQHWLKKNGFEVIVVRKMTLQKKAD